MSPDSASADTTPAPMSEPNVTALGNGAFRIARPDGTHAIAFGVADGARSWVFLDGQTFIVEPRQSRRGTANQDPSSLAAPMPATVARVHVTPGQRVKAGEVLVTLEAMKMELAIRAVAEGVVKAINCEAGELVQPGRPLIDLT